MNLKMSLDGKSGTPRCSHFVTNFLNGRKKEKKKRRKKGTKILEIIGDYQINI